MNYSSPEFILSFPVFCGVYWLLPGQTARLVALVAASAAFYASGEPAGLALLAGVVLLTFGAGMLIRRWPAWTMVVVAASIAVLLADLAYFKYAAFLLGVVAPGTRIVPPLFLPLGISFFTFEAISYVVDLRRGVTSPERSLIRLSLFIGVFPHLISGPIMRANDILPQLRSRIAWHAPTFASGLQLFVEGLVKKRLIADTAGAIVDSLFAHPATIGTAGAWTAALAYTVQIYGDFAGYTDMGRGIARMLGLELPLNFDAPYAASSITDFWRRWHITLSSWLRDYLYIALGGNRKGAARAVANLLVTMLLGGLWHGASWTFVVWGAYHGTLLALERVFRPWRRLPSWLAWAVSLLLVVNGWVLFRAQDFSAAATVLREMYVPTPGDTSFGGGAAALFAVVVGTMVVKRTWPGLLDRLKPFGVPAGIAYAAVALVVLLAAPTAVRPFIYFRF